MAIQYARKRFTVDEYHKMVKTGILSEDDRVELIDGEIVQMTPIKVPHAVCVDRLNKLLNRILPEEITVRVQSPILLGNVNEPEPDLAVLKPRDYLNMEQHPGPEDILLVIEVSGTTLNFDRRVKMPLYAQAGIPETWIVNIAKGVVEVYSNPVNGKYESIRTAGRADTVAPDMHPDVKLRVEDFLGVRK